jgi:hypothetical protein
MKDRYSGNIVAVLNSRPYFSPISSWNSESKQDEE